MQRAAWKDLGVDHLISFKINLKLFSISWGHWGRFTREFHSHIITWNYPSLLFRNGIHYVLKYWEHFSFLPSYSCFVSLYLNWKYHAKGRKATLISPIRLGSASFIRFPSLLPHPSCSSISNKRERGQVVYNMKEALTNKSEYVTVYNSLLPLNIGCCRTIFSLLAQQ